MQFNCNPEAFTMLADRLDDMLKFAIETENDCKMSEITNYDEVRDKILGGLHSLRDRPSRRETPLIYHLDVGAMYPNIILTNRLQPTAMVTADVCAGCVFNAADNRCKRVMEWKWKGEMFTASRAEYAHIKAQLETESFSGAAADKIDAGAVTKQAYGNRKGNVLEGTAFERKSNDDWKKGKGKGDAFGGGYRKNTSERARQEAREALLQQDKDDDADSDSDDGANKAFAKLRDDTQQALLKKRMGEYSRKAYRKTHETREVLKDATVCQRENSFYVDTVRLFRDRRYHYKRELKRWKGLLEKAIAAEDIPAMKEAKSRTIQMESLQLAHKCILNSFYGYVMRKGSRWYSMEMAGVVTYLGAGLIMMARVLVQDIGITLELDTDGIWCCLPSSFPEDFTFTTSNP
jgi:DNA polymerase epsilon subunit 1